MANILITGGSGFIGQHFHGILDQLKLINLDLVEPIFKYNAKYVRGDIRIESDVEKAIKDYKIDTILSLAAKHHDFGIGHDEYYDTNEEGTKIICKVASKYGIKKIIFFSSVAVYGDLNTESHELIEPQPSSPYGGSKLAGEQVLKQWYEQDLSRTVIILRPTVVYGPHNRANMFNLIRQIDSGLYFHIGEAANIKSIAYVENLVQATMFLAKKFNIGFHVFNYADDPQLSSRKIADLIAERLANKIRFTIPLKIAIMLGLPFDLFIKLTGKNLPISTARIKKLNTQTHHRAEKIFKEGFVPSFSSIDGLLKMVDWYKTNKAS